VIPVRTRNLLAITFALCAWTFASASAAFAHGGMASPDELGQPLAISGAIAFVCYWAVVLWPTRKRNDHTQTKRRRPSRKRGRIAVGNGDRPAVSLKAVGRGSDG